MATTHGLFSVCARRVGHPGSFVRRHLAHQVAGEPLDFLQIGHNLTLVLDALRGRWRIRKVVLFICGSIDEGHDRVALAYLNVVGELQHQLTLVMRVLHRVAALGRILLVHALGGDLKVLPVLQEHHGCGLDWRWLSDGKKNAQT